MPMSRKGRSIRIASVVLALSFGASATAFANPNLLQNGDFTSFTVNSGLGGSAAGGQIGYNVTLAGWSTTGYNFLYTLDPGTISGISADNGGATGQNGNQQLWGPGNGSANGLFAPPSGGNLVAASGGAQAGALSQVISGLTVGDKYTVSFLWALAQGTGATGATSDKWSVSLGSESYQTPSVANASQGFTIGALPPGTPVSFTYTATSATEDLSFLASGTPAASDPFALLGGVSLTVVPEPASLALLGVGLAGLALRRLRIKGAAVQS